MESPEFMNSNKLRDYQLEGLNWLLFNWYNCQNCILADEMGLGKTIQTIAFLTQVQAVGVKGPFLVVAPLSTLANWQREFETWSNINSVVYHGSLQSRRMIGDYEMYHRDDKGNLLDGLFKFEVMITTYEMVKIMG
jgi:chromodomain helicase DNA binding protein 8